MSVAKNITLKGTEADWTAVISLEGVDEAPDGMLTTLLHTVGDAINTLAPTQLTSMSSLVIILEKNGTRRSSQGTAEPLSIPKVH